MPTWLLTATAATTPRPRPPFAKTVLLYNVLTDPNETTDLSAANPGLVQQLLADLDAAPRAASTLSEWPTDYPP